MGTIHFHLFVLFFYLPFLQLSFNSFRRERIIHLFVTSTFSFLKVTKMLLRILCQVDKIMRRNSYEIFKGQHFEDSAPNEVNKK